MMQENELTPYEISEIPCGPFVVFAPHPDDEAIGMGGTIAIATDQGINVTVIFATRGEMGGDPNIRSLECAAAAKRLGIHHIYHLDLEDRKVSNSRFPEKRVLDILAKVNPECVFLPSFQEIHPDHRALTAKVLCVLEKASFRPQLWFYEIIRQGEINRLIPVDIVIDKKLAAIKCYSSQIVQLNYDHHAMALDTLRNITLNKQFRYVEGFWCHNGSLPGSPADQYFRSIDRYRNHLTRPAGI